MASTNSCVPQSSLVPGISRAIIKPTKQEGRPCRRIPLRRFGVSAAAVTPEEGPKKRQRAPPGVDTRIHWDNDEDGWVGGTTSTSSSSSSKPGVDDQKNFLGQDFADLLYQSTDSHYQFLGVTTDADMEEIRSAYRRLSKEYHPDTTSLPIKTASEKFLRLREVYNVLSNQETRRFYDWTLAQEVASRQDEKMKINLKDPRVQEIENYVPVPDVINRLDGKNMKLSDQAMTALTIDGVILIFTICCIVFYIVFYKDLN